MSQIVYDVQRKDGTWAARQSRSAAARIGAGRLIKGRGRFTIVAPFRKPNSHKAIELPRTDAIDATFRVLGEMTAGDRIHIRDGRGQVVFLARADWNIDPRREEVARHARWGVENAPSIHYAQTRPYPMYRQHHLPMTLDCSSSTMTYCRWAGAPDPSGHHYDGYGNTDSILANLKPRAKISDAQLGDLILFHNGSDAKHVAIVVKPGRDPLLASHGSENGPLLLRFSVEYRYHAGETATAVDLLS